MSKVDIQKTVLYSDVLHGKALQDAVAFQKTWHNQESEQPNYTKLQSQLGTYLDKMNGWQTHLLEFEKKCMTKWGPQGFTRSYEELRPTVMQYYDRANTMIPDVQLRVTQKLLAGVLPLIGDDLLCVWGGRKSNGGLSGWYDRRTPGFREEAFEEARSLPYHYDPVVLGQKNERGKVRTIFMDSFANYYRSQSVWAPVMDRLARSGMCNMTDRITLDRKILGWMSRHQDYTALEGDAESMDTWMDEVKMGKLSHHLEGHATDEWLEAYDTNWTQLWQVPLLTPEGMYYGHHSLFSGLVPTHPSECLWMIETMEDLVRYIEWKPGVVPRYGEEYIFVVCGDDTLLLVDNQAVKRIPTPDEVAAHWRKWGMAAHPEKQRVAANAGAFFCKRYYHPRLKASVYPISLAANAFSHPKSGRPVAGNAFDVIRFVQIMDEVTIHHPLYLEGLLALTEEFPFLKSVKLTPDDVETYNNSTSANWRIAVFGERFDPTNSPTMNLLAKFFG